MSNLHVDSVVKNYGSRSVLSDIFVSCDTGEVVGLVGRNGSGKSTLMKIIAGTLNAENSFVGIDGCRLANLREKYRRIKYLPQTAFLPGHLKIRTAVDLLCGQHGYLVADDPAIKPFLSKRSRELSGGERRFVEVMLLVYSDAEFVLLDEPFNGISPLRISEIRKHILSQAATKGFIITDHNYRSLLETATRTVLLFGGATRMIDGYDDLRMLGYMP